jgi:mannose-6-phosphate isomerase-like protein (cupin superfamily)
MSIKLKKTSKPEDLQIIKNIPVDFKEEKYLEIGVRPWGVYYVLEDKSTFKVKKIIVNPDNRLSLQSHKHRSEHWIVVSGRATIEIQNGSVEDEWKFELPPNESCFIPINTKHRLANYGLIPLVLVEVQVGEYTGEDDIERFEDDYLRVEK